MVLCAVGKANNRFLRFSGIAIVLAPGGLWRVVTTHGRGLPPLLPILGVALICLNILITSMVSLVRPGIVEDNYADSAVNIIRRPGTHPMHVRK
jgi:hypothetical protein